MRPRLRYFGFLGLFFASVIAVFFYGLFLI
jgi:hypothetical protein